MSLKAAAFPFAEAKGTESQNNSSLPTGPPRRSSLASSRDDPRRNNACHLKDRSWQCAACVEARRRESLREIADIISALSAPAPTAARRREPPLDPLLSQEGNIRPSPGEPGGACETLPCGDPKRAFHALPSLAPSLHLRWPSGDCPRSMSWSMFESHTCQPAPCVRPGGHHVIS
jgi:hypothetical protein